MRTYACVSNVFARICRNVLTRIYRNVFTRIYRYITVPVWPGHERRLLVFCSEYRRIYRAEGRFCVLSLCWCRNPGVGRLP